jgi:hypothetical protein
MILKKENFFSTNNESSTFITEKQLIGILDSCPEFKADLLNVFNVNDEVLTVLEIGNSKQLIDAIHNLDSQCYKLDLPTKMRDVYLKKMLDGEKASFEVFSIKDDYIIKNINTDLLVAETRYNAKTDILDYYNFGKFANYCRDNMYEDLVDEIQKYLLTKNLLNEDVRNLRLLHHKEDNIFFIRALTSTGDYKNFGINFSVFVAIKSLANYVRSSGNNIHIDSFQVDDSNIYVSFAFSEKTKINDKIDLSFNLILENDEVKRSSVSFNGLFKLTFKDNDKSSYLYIKPKGFKKDDSYHPVDLLSYPHRGSIKGVFEKIEQLPKSIEFFIKQVSEDAKRIATIQHPDDVRKFIINKVKKSKKTEFKVYKDKVFNKLMSVNVDTTFKLFSLLRQVEDLFEHDDVISLNFWRSKLYEALVERE